MILFLRHVHGLQSATAVSLDTLRPHVKARYQLNEHSKFIMESKLRICVILRKVLDIALDVRLSKFIDAFVEKQFDAHAGLFLPLTNLVHRFVLAWQLIIGPRM